MARGKRFVTSAAQALGLAKPLHAPIDTREDLPFHPLADLFPLIEGEEFEALVASIRDNGQHEPVIVHEGQILDGRNRWRACRAAGIQPLAEPFRGDDPVAFVIDHNLRRRHLNESQRALVAARLANLKGGRPAKETGEISPVSQARAADLMNVSRDSVKNARAVLTRGTPDDVAAVQSGAAAASTIAKRIRAVRPPEERDAARERRLPTAAQSASRAAQREQAAIWRRLSDTLDALIALPEANELATIAAAQQDRTDALQAQLMPALRALELLAVAWRRSRGETP